MEEFKNYRIESALIGYDFMESDKDGAEGICPNYTTTCEYLNP